MGQAQSSRQRSVPYREVELDLWELDGDEDERSGRGGSRRQTGNRNGSRQTGSRSVVNRQVSGRSRSGDRNRADAVNRQVSDRSRSRDRNPAGADSRGRSVNESRQGNRSARNIRAYEQRQGSTGRNRSESRNRNRTNGQGVVCELQVQDIRRYQNVRSRGYAVAAAGYAYEGSARPVQSIKRRKARKRKIFFARMTAAVFVVLCLALIYILTGEIYRFVHSRQTYPETEPEAAQTIAEKVETTGIAPPAIIEDYLEVNDYSRPGTQLNRVNNIFVHYTANPGTSAAQNRSYFANLAITQERSASAHLIIGYEGEIVQCIPLDEQAYAVMTRNEDSISIECCYTAEDGSFTPETYDTLVHTLAWLLDKYDLSTDDILRHYDCGGKMCPIYYVEHEDAWQQLLQDVAVYKESGEV